MDGHGRRDWDNERLTLVTRVNGKEMQRATTDMMIHSIPRQIAYISTFMPLAPGDVIVTGTPGGVGLRRILRFFLKMAMLWKLKWTESGFCATKYSTKGCELEIDQHKTS